MKSKSMKAILAVVVGVAMITTGCMAQWIGVALADLPVLTQMALNITSLGVTLQSGQQISAADAAAIQNISSEASKDLNLLQRFTTSTGPARTRGPCRRFKARLPKSIRICRSCWRRCM